MSDASKEPENRGAIRGPDGRFLPGNNGNPGGRPRVPDEIKARLREIGPEMLERLICLAQSANREDVRLAAITKMLQYAYGKGLSPDEEQESPADEKLMRYLEALSRK